MPTCKCLECGEVIEHKYCCAKHHLETKHDEFEIIGADVKLTIKS